jgi:thiosulfate dehydrogenase [quinone] large subunit
MEVKEMNTKHIAYLLARVTMGINLLAHGLVRFPKLQGFQAWMLEYFHDSMLPIWTVKLWAGVLPFLEFGLGLGLILGLFTRKVLIGGAVIILVLIFGSCLKENWEWVSFQMIYAIYFFFLLIYVEYNHYSIDRVFFTNDK